MEIMKQVGAHFVLLVFLVNIVNRVAIWLNRREIKYKQKVAYAFLNSESCKFFFNYISSTKDKAASLSSIKVSI